MTTQYDLTGNAQALAAQALATLADVMSNGKDRDRVAAAKEVLARGHGNSYTQAAPSSLQSQLAQQLAGLSDSQLLAIAQAARGQLAAPIDGRTVGLSDSRTEQVAVGGEGEYPRAEGPQAGGIEQGTPKANFKSENTQSALQNFKSENTQSAMQNGQDENIQPVVRDSRTANAPDKTPDVKGSKPPNRQAGQSDTKPAKRPRAKTVKQPVVDTTPEEEDDLLS